jgi:hypothetical protein
MRNPVLAGRTFSEADNTPESSSVVIDQSLAAKAFPFESAVGKRILLRTYRKPGPEWVQIVGVVAHQRDNSLTDRDMAGRQNSLPIWRLNAPVRRSALISRPAATSTLWAFFRQVA